LKNDNYKFILLDRPTTVWRFYILQYAKHKPEPSRTQNIQ